MIRLELAGAHTRLGSTLCAECPQGPTGCCFSPPEFDWSDIGRVVSLGGRGWLLEQLAAGALFPAARGLQIQRARRRASNAERRRNKCVFHGPEGCTIAPEQRPATCNYFLCEDAFTEGSKLDAQEAAQSRRAHAALTAMYARWDEALARELRAAFPEGVSWDAGFLDWLGAAFERLCAEQGQAPGALLRER